VIASRGRLPVGIAVLALGLVGLAPVLAQAPEAGAGQEPAATQAPVPAPARPPAPAPASKASPESELVPIPEPDLEGVEPDVVRQIQEARSVLDKSLGADVAAAVRSEAYGELGRVYHAYGLTGPAEAAYRDAHVLAPGDFRWVYYLGYLLQGEGRFEEAAKAYGQAVNLKSHDVAALVHLGEVYLELANLPYAEAAFQRALSVEPGLAAAEAGLGQIALSKKDYQGAADHLEAALAAAPEANKLHYPLALAYRGLGRMDEARDQLAQRGLVGVKPPDPLADQLQELKKGERVQILRGRMAYRAGHYKEAAASFRAAVEARPDSVPARINLGSALARLGDRVGAIEQFHQVLAVAPDNATAQFDLGVLLIQDGAPDQAVEHLSAAAASDPGDGEVQRELGKALSLLGRSKEALEHLHRAVELAPFDAEARVDEAEELVRLGRVADARDRLDEAHALMPRSPVVVTAFARLLAASPLYDVRDGKRALKLSQELVRAWPTPESAETLAMALAEVGRCDEAAAWQRHAMDALHKAGKDNRIGAMEPLLRRYENDAPCRYPGHASGDGKGQ